MDPRSAPGHGVGLRVPHYEHVLRHGVAGVDWLEVISENLFQPGGRPWAVLDRARADVPIVLHGVSMAIGNAAPLDDDYLAALRSLIARVAPARVSDHLCWGGHAGRYAHDLLPLPFTVEALDHVVARTEEAQERLGRQLLLENVSSYVTFAASVIPEWEFLVEVARRSGCGLLLDVNNVFVSARNHAFSAERYVDAIPGELIGQVHVAGHTDRGTWLLDSHVGPVPDPVWALYRRLVARVGPKPTLVEWDEQIPPDFATLVAEAQRARAIEQEVRPAAA
jgi:uncharacterized protein (UPF0276 family)